MNPKFPRNFWTCCFPLAAPPCAPTCWFNVDSSSRIHSFLDIEIERRTFCSPSTTRRGGLSRDGRGAFPSPLGPDRAAETGFGRLARQRCIAARLLPGARRGPQSQPWTRNPTSGSTID